MLRRYSITTLFCALIVVGSSRAFGEVHLVADSETSAEISADTYRVKMNFVPDPNITVFSQEHGTREQIGSFPLEGFAATAGNTSPAGAARSSAPPRNRIMVIGCLEFRTLSQLASSIWSH